MRVSVVLVPRAEAICGCGFKELAVIQVPAVTHIAQASGLAGELKEGLSDLHRREPRGTHQEVRKKASRARVQLKITGWPNEQWRMDFLEFIRPGKPVENSYIENFHGRLRDECLNVQLFYSRGVFGVLGYGKAASATSNGKAIDAQS